MKIVAKYSHLDGFTILRNKYKPLWKEIKRAINNVNADNCKTKKGKEQTNKGRKLYSPEELNKSFKSEFIESGWDYDLNTTYYTTDNKKLLKKVLEKNSAKQKKLIKNAGKTPIKTSLITDFYKKKVAIEVQFGKYPYVMYDLFVKHTLLYASGKIDVGIEIVPMKTLERCMSSGVPYFEHNQMCLMQLGEENGPAVPAVLIGIEPPPPMMVFNHLLQIFLPTVE